MFGALCVVVLGQVSVCKAQDAAPGSTVGEKNHALRIGALLGVNLNQFDQPLATIGVNAGGVVRYVLTDFLDLQGELLYSLQGGGRTEYTRALNQFMPSYDGLVDYVRYINRNVYLNNLEVPVIVRITLPKLAGGGVVPRLLLGGSYSYNFKAYEKNDKIFYFVDGTQGMVSNTIDDVSLEYYKHNFSGYAGVALDARLQNGHWFTVEVRYRRGFVDLNRTETIIVELTEKLYSTGLSFNFSYQIF